MKLHSFFEPGLRASDTPYTLTTRQTLSSGTESFTKPSSLTFTVDAPRFSIPASEIHSVYPAPGSSEHARVLPHVVLNDPQLPWERAVPEDNDKNLKRQPWMALLVFTADELQATPLPGTKNTPSPTHGLSASVSQLVQADQAQASSFRCPNVNSHDAKDETAVTYIMLKKQLFETLIVKNKAIFSYFSHVRRVDVTGSAHVSDKPEEHPFSVVFSPRTGPVEGKDQAVYVHLVSLDGVADNLKDRVLTADVQTVGLISLYAWSYRICPGDEISYRDILSNLDKDRQPLRRPKDLIEGLAKDENNAWLVERLQAGYTPTRHRTLTGETTVAFYRGPLTPLYIPPRQCVPTTAGRELQILDPRTGIMDVSYSAAWELGRNLAITDKAFTAAMLRLRSDIMAYAVKDPEREKSKSTFAALGRKPAKHNLYSGVYRWANTKPSKQASTPSSSVDSALQSQVREWLQRMADSQVQAELNNTKPTASTDWIFVLQWVQRKLALQGIPALYLFPDPAVLPLEAFRTFYVDENWTDALVDGALSIANHSLGEDGIKREIRKSFNVYFDAIQKENPALATAWRPRWGLILRSQLVRAYPNLRIERENNNVDVEAAFTTLTEDTLIYYQSETPETTKDTALVISQPFHHQRFSLGDDLTASRLEMSFKLFRTTGDEAKEKEQLDGAINLATWTPGSTALFKCKTDAFDDITLGIIYDWTTRCIDIKELIKSCKELNERVMKDLCVVQEDSAAYIGLQLNDEILMLRMDYERTQEEDSKPRLLNDPDILTSQTSTPGNMEKTEKRVEKTMFIPEPALINTALLPPVHGFNLDSLKAAVPFVPVNEPVAYNNLQPITTSQLSKICSPLLAHPRRNFPAGAPITLDIVFSMTAITDVRQDLYLGEVAVYIPMGEINSNLLQVKATRPKARMIGPGRLWNITSRLVKGKRHRINLEGDWSMQDAVDGHDQLYLGVTISALQDHPLHLLRHGQVSFLLQEMQINPLPCERVPLLVEEAYFRATDEGEYEDVGRVKTVVGVTKEDCKWV
ncbi:hypothetical protein ASPZODRAFT_147782 [Penicilliopsis zonata CBS 506.65]|uniref:Uncharacterized protein n=1 Tax=Penicilliopsis zonata CBS 506.65 TaxID=1073090 RepID=A0A1L9S4J9_9EURO|nr:hypothetical protein ASPZODRAFT_147782 [Penicilliopsis zonata CBS 506.65]OJJ42077.1 hypothetical protein ASPZODRAFT_147782 [Penicilliopsis zonata CBS 506.65]